MGQIAVTIKIDKDLKEEVQAFGKKVGLSFSSIVENRLRQVAKDRLVIFEDDLVPNKKFARRLTNIQQDIKNDRNIMRFESNDDALDFLKSL